MSHYIHGPVVQKLVVFGGGYVPAAVQSAIDYNTIASTGNSIDFGLEQSMDIRNSMF